MSLTLCSLLEREVHIENNKDGRMFDRDKYMSKTIIRMFWTSRMESGRRALHSSTADSKEERDEVVLKDY
ncbi:unnamed protein product [Fusarium graminearum]|uniref:Uncharacterized protein n=1 Tax=Gibberella zeae TaxID=5518 RepID=A0A4E9EIU6_GIBZA|nr:unnamed protein product [Fusarium graminearum]CAG1994150.1 unnamed protein product [Fusarium graminearum]CAG1998407.1 unnamed protein product [Fusarium graminearum]